MLPGGPSPRLLPAWCWGTLRGMFYRSQANRGRQPLRGFRALPGPFLRARSAIRSTRDEKFREVQGRGERHGWAGQRGRRQGAPEGPSRGGRATRQRPGPQSTCVPATPPLDPHVCPLGSASLTSSGQSRVLPPLSWATGSQEELMGPPAAGHTRGQTPGSQPARGGQLRVGDETMDGAGVQAPDPRPGLFTPHCPHWPGTRTLSRG